LFAISEEEEGERRRRGRRGESQILAIGRWLQEEEWVGGWWGSNWLKLNKYTSSC